MQALCIVQVEYDKDEVSSQGTNPSIAGLTGTIISHLCKNADDISEQ